MTQGYSWLGKTIWNQILDSQDPWDPHDKKRDAERNKLVSGAPVCRTERNQWHFFYSTLSFQQGSPGCPPCPIWDISPFYSIHRSIEQREASERLSLASGSQSFKKIPVYRSHHGDSDLIILGKPQALAFFTNSPSPCYFKEQPELRPLSWSDSKLLLSSSTCLLPHVNVNTSGVHGPCLSLLRESEGL